MNNAISVQEVANRESNARFVKAVNWGTFAHIVVFLLVLLPRQGPLHSIASYANRISGEFFVGSFFVFLAVGVGSIFWPRLLTSFAVMLGSGLALGSYAAMMVEMDGVQLNWWVGPAAVFLIFVATRLCLNPARSN
jgi:hypothetical protein